MPKLIVHLKQHTPIMHFQHDEEDATIRGTELKPQLDRFLIQCEFGGDVSKIDKIDKKLRMSDTGALNYRVKINATDKLYTCDKTPYFTTDETPKHQATFSKELVCVTFLTPFPQIIKYLQKWIARFFFFTNFGYRKNQGFGCFSVQRMRVENGNPEDIAEFTPDMVRKAVTEICKILKENSVNKGERTDNKDADKKICVPKMTYYDVVYQLTTEKRDWLPIMKDIKEWYEAIKIGKKYKSAVYKKMGKLERLEGLLLFKPLQNKDTNWFIYIILHTPSQITWINAFDPVQCMNNIAAQPNNKLVVLAPAEGA